MRLWFCLCAALSFSSLLPAQPVEWQPRGIGGGGALFLPSINPAQSGEIFIACDMSQLFHTSTAGTSWNIIPSGHIQTNASHGRVEFTSTTGLLYSISYTGEVPVPVQSTDGGATWNPLTDPTEGEAYDLWSDYDNPNRLLLTSYSALFVSTDGGTTWNERDATAHDGGYYIAGAFFDGQTILLGTNTGLRISTDGGTNFAPLPVSGIPDDEAMVSFTAATDGEVTRLFCVTLGAGDVYNGVVATDNQNYQGLYKLDLGQQEWTSLSNRLPDGVLPYFIAMARNNTSTAYVAGGSDNSTPTIYKTTDGGETWQNVFITENNGNISTGWSGNRGDREWSYGEYALGFTVNRNDANRAVITDFGFAHATTDGGITWKQLYADPSTENAMGQQTPKGKEYISVGLENTTCWHIEWVDAQTMISCFSDIRGIRSDDGGTSWSFHYTGHTDNSMYHCLKHPTSDVLYAATSTVHDLYQSTYLADSRIDNGKGKVLFSTNRGKTWQTLHDFGHPVFRLAIDPNNTNRLYACVVHSSEGGIYVSNDIGNGSGSTWTRLTSPSGTEGHPFDIHVLHDGTLVCTYSGRRAGSPLVFTPSSGVFVSTNGGTTWEDRSDVGMKYWTKDLIIDPHDPQQQTWYVGVFSGWGGAPNGKGGLYRTTNRGATWSKINTLDRVTSCAVNPDTPGEAYLTTETDGLWFCSDIRTSSPVFNKVESYPFRQPERVFFNPYNKSQIWVTSFGNGMRVGQQAATEVAENQPETASNIGVFPNPAQNQSTIRYTVPQPTRVTIAVHDLAGRELMVLVNAQQAAGSYHVPADFALPDGSYLCVITTGQKVQARLFTILNGK